MATTDHYDVVIIGSGAGGGTLAWKLAPSGKRILLLERGGYLPRERDNWDTEAVFLRGKYLTTETLARRRRQRASRPSRTTTSAATPSSTARRCSGCGPRTSARSPTTAASPRPGRSPTTSFEPYYAPGRGPLRRARRRPARTRPTVPAAATYPYPPVKHEPRIQQLSDDLEQPRPAPVAPADRRDARPGRRRRTRSPSSRCIRCDRVDGFPCLVDGKADAQIVCVDPALAHPNLDLVTNAKVDRLETDAAGPPGHRRGRHARRRHRGPLLRRHRRGVVRRAQLGAAAAALGQRRPSRPGWPTAPTRSGATTCATTTWR